MAAAQANKAKSKKTPQSELQFKNDYDSIIENNTSSVDTDAKRAKIYEFMSESGSDIDLNVHTENNASKRKIAPAIEPTTKKHKNLNKFQKVKPPTLEEINELKETRNLFHSNLFRLQVKEILNELKIKRKYITYIKSWLDMFTIFMQNLKSSAEKEPNTQMQWHNETINIKTPLRISDVSNPKPFYFQFIKPYTKPFFIDAAATQTLLGPELVVEICVLMPPECFQRDDYLNLVYDQKRAYYLQYITNEMQKSTEFSNQTFAYNYYNNNPLKPVLEITPNNKLGKKLCIRLLVAAEVECFKLKRFVPWNNNIRSTLFGDDTKTETALPATPHYNANILQDLTLKLNQKLLYAVFERSKNFQEGLLLLKVWLKQRQLGIGFTGFHSHILAMYIMYLCKQHKLNEHMSSYQVARNVWHYLANSKWDQNGQGISLAILQNDGTNQSPSLEQFHAFYEVVFVDTTGYLNLCSNVTRELYCRVRREAKLAVDMLNDMKVNSFQLIFMQKRPLYIQFDHILKIQKPDAVEQLLDLHVPLAVKYDYVNYAYPQLLQLVMKLLRKGLGKRVCTLIPIEQPFVAWRVYENAAIGARYLHLGIILNPENAYNVIDKGPESIAPEAIEFRKFWGDVAQLRRFQDGSIAESVVWCNANDSLAKKRLIVHKIITHLLQQRFQLDANDIDYIGANFDVAFKLTSAFKVDALNQNYNITQENDAETMTPLIINCFDELRRQLHSLKNLPLEIVSIAGISPSFRYCEPEPMLPRGRIINDGYFGTYLHCGVMQLGMNGKWPNELKALRACKLAFCIRIQQLLRDEFKLKTKLTYDGILIYKKGHFFKIELAHSKELTLLKQEKNVNGVTQYIDNPASLELEKRHFILPKLTGALHALYKQYPGFGPAAMIAKRWFGVQLIDDGLWPSEAIELLVASLFINNAYVPEQTCVPQTCFYRFLHLLANCDWQNEMFLLNFNNILDDKKVADLQHQFLTTREIFPPLTIMTAYDQMHFGHVWTTADKPNSRILARVRLLARQALAIIEEAINSSERRFIKLSHLFTASHDGYDLVIQLKSELIPNVLAYEFGSPFAALDKPNYRLPPLGTNYIIEAVEKLRSAYSDYAAFFYNPYGGKEIGIVWKPSTAFEAKLFKVNEVNGCTPCKDNPTKVRCLKETLIEDFKFILQDLYVRIDTVGEVLRKTSESKARYFKQR